MMNNTYISSNKQLLHFHIYISLDVLNIILNNRLCGCPPILAQHIKVLFSVSSGDG